MSAVTYYHSQKNT